YLENCSSTNTMLQNISASSRSDSLETNVGGRGYDDADCACHSRADLRDAGGGRRGGSGELDLGIACRAGMPKSQDRYGVGNNRGGNRLDRPSVRDAVQRSSSAGVDSS